MSMAGLPRAAPDSVDLHAASDAADLRRLIVSRARDLVGAAGAVLVLPGPRKRLTSLPRSASPRMTSISGSRSTRPPEFLSPNASASAAGWQWKPRRVVLRGIPSWQG